MGSGGFTTTETNRTLIAMESTSKLLFSSNDKYRKYITYHGGCNVYSKPYTLIIL